LRNICLSAHSLYSGTGDFCGNSSDDAKSGFRSKGRIWTIAIENSSDTSFERHPMNLSATIYLNIKVVTRARLLLKHQLQTSQVKFLLKTSQLKKEVKEKKLEKYKLF